MSPFILNGEILPSGFTVYRCDRGSRGGGVLLAVNNSLPSRQLPTPSLLELLTVEVSSKPPILICVVYIPPSSSLSYYSEIFHYLDSFAPLPRSVIVGDFNLPDISWSTLNSLTPQSSALCDLVFRHNLIQLIDFPTHSKGSTLYLVLTGSDDLILNLHKVSSLFLSSDHSLVSFDVSTMFTQHTSRTCNQSVFDFKRTDFDSLSSFLQDVDFAPLFLSSNVEFAWSFLKETILYAISLFTPQNRVKSHSQPVWFHHDVRHQLNKIHSLRKLCKRSPTTNNRGHLSATEYQLQGRLKLTTKTT